MNAPVTVCQFSPQSSRGYYEFNKCGKPATQQEVGYTDRSGEHRWSNLNEWSTRDRLYCDKHANLRTSSAKRRKYSDDRPLFEAFDRQTILAEYNTAAEAERVATVRAKHLTEVSAAALLLLNNVVMNVQLADRLRSIMELADDGTIDLKPEGVTA